MTTVIIIILVCALCGWYLFRKQPAESKIQPSPFYDDVEHLAEPVISYTLYVVDIHSGRRIQMQTQREFNNQFGILNGQAIELHWNVLNADWISIEGVGFVQAIGKKEFYPSINTKYSITAKNRNYEIEREFFVRVFPVPVMMKLIVPMPELATNNIHLFRAPIPAVQKIQPVQFPSLLVPSVISIGKINIDRPKNIEFNKKQLTQLDATLVLSIKNKLFDKMENAFSNNYKVKDILKTIRKHYGPKF